MQKIKPLKTNVPLTASDQASLGFFERFGAPIVERNRWFVFSMLAVLTIVALGLAIYGMLPLKTVASYRVDINNEGMVKPVPIEVQNFTVQELEKRYFLGQWAIKLLTMDQAMTETYLKEAFLLTRDKAQSEFNAFMQEKHPIADLTQDPKITQQVTIRTISFVQDGVALVRLKIEKRSGMQAVETKNQLITVHYALIPPKTEAEIYENPLGMFITHFAVSEDIY